MMRNRRKAREFTLQVLYQADIRDIPPTQALKITLSRYRFTSEIESFSSKLVEGTEKFLPWIDELIKHYAKNWTLERMAVVDRNILRLSIYELLLVKEVPPVVSINEAVEIAKRYGTEDSGKFVNGILDKIRRERAIDSALKWGYLKRKLKSPPLISFINLKDIQKAYLVGGFIRNSLLGRESADLDILIDGANFDLVEKFARYYGKSPVCLSDGLRRVLVRRGCQFDFTLKKSSSLESDLKKRDFTIDALAIDLDHIDNPHLCLVDVKNGLEDLLNKKIALVNERAFDDDPLRMLKAFRLKSQLDFELDDTLAQMIFEKYQLIDKVAKERIREELFIILNTPNSGEHLCHPSVKKLLDRIFNLPPNPDNLCYLEKILNSKENLFTPFKPQVVKYLGEKVGGVTRLFLLKLMSLFLCSSSTERISKSITEALKLGRRQEKLIQKVVSFIPLLDQLKDSSLLSSNVSSFLLEAGEETVETCLLAAVLRREDVDYLQFYSRVLSIFFKKRSLILSPPRLLSGDELMSTFGIKPGPELSSILKKIHQAQISGDVQGRDDAVELVQKILSNSEKNQI